jgi:multidrug efflux pump subunit AcrB
MTSLAFILGVVLLATSDGADPAGQNAIGIGVIGGMIAATTLGILFVPLFFVAVRRPFPGWEAVSPANRLQEPAPSR